MTRRVLRGPGGSVAVEMLRFAKPGRFQIMANDGDGFEFGELVGLDDLVKAGFRRMEVVAGDPRRAPA